MTRSPGRSQSSIGSRLSRRMALQCGGLGLAVALGTPTRTVAAAQDATPIAARPLPPAIEAVMRLRRYPVFAQWGLSVTDRETGEAIYDLRSTQRYVPGSTTKLFPAAAALAAYGPDFRFETPVYRQGTGRPDLGRSHSCAVTFHHQYRRQHQAERLRLRPP